MHTIKLLKEVYNTLIQTAAESPEREICGFLYGSAKEEVTEELKKREERIGALFVPIPNIAKSSSEFIMDPQVVVDTLFHMQRGTEGVEKTPNHLISIVHSHPLGRYQNIPSSQDIRNHWSTNTWSLILFRDKTHWDIACYRIAVGTYTKVDIQIDK